MAYNIETVPIVELLEGNEGTHLGDLDTLRSRVFDYTLRATLIGREHVEIDFKGYTIPSIELVNNMLKTITDELGVTFSCINWTLPGAKDGVNGYEILREFERDEYSGASELEYTFIRLCGLIDDHLKREKVCVLDFSSIHISASMTDDMGVKLTGEQFSVTKLQSLIILVRLKAKYNEQLLIEGLNYHSVSKFAYILSYFTMPHCTTIEEVKEFIQAEYKPKDFIFFNSVEIRQSVSEKVTEYNARRVEKLVAIADVFNITEIDRSNLQLGLVVETNDTGIMVLPIRIESISTTDELTQGRFRYILSESATLIEYADLMGDEETGIVHKIIHGVDMSSDAVNLYEIIKDLEPNPPRERKIYYSEGRKNMYQNYLYSHVEQETFKQINLAPTMENIAKATDIGTAYINPIDLI